MKKIKNRTPMRLLSLILAAMLFVGAMPFGIFAKEADISAAAEPVVSADCTVIAHGGIIKSDKTGAAVNGKVSPGTAVRITLDESAFSGHTFVCWKGDDGTVIPQKSFRLLVERNCAFYPEFSDLKGNFGDWQELLRGELCTDGVLYVREDAITGLKQYKFTEDSHDYQYAEMPDGENHYVTCSRCAYTETTSHNWSDGIISKEPTHTEDGEKTFTCSGCNAVKSEIIPAHTDDHNYSYEPDDGDWVVVEEPNGTEPGKRALKCLYCGKIQDSSVPFIKSSLPEGNIKLSYKQTCNSIVDTSSREEEHYISDNAYFFYINRKSNPYSFGMLWVDEGENSPVYIRSGDRYGTDESLYYGILCYVDNREEFLDVIKHQLGIYAYNNGRDTAHMYSIGSGYRAFEETYNRLARAGADQLAEKLVMTSDFKKYSFWDEPLREYKYYYNSFKTITYYVDANNACIKQIDGSDVMEILSKEPFDEFPYSAPDRSKITYYSYYAFDGSYGNNYYDGADFGMASPDWDDKDRKLTPKNRDLDNKVFDYWEKRDPETLEWSFASDNPNYIPSVSDVTVVRAVFKDKTYHIKVNGGYYSKDGSNERFTEGDIKVGTRINLIPDTGLVPEGSKFDKFVDADNKDIGSSVIPTGDSVYNAVYTDKTVYVNSYAVNGGVFKDGESFWGGYFKAGDKITLTTESYGDEYPYFLGWYSVSSDDFGETVYEPISTERTLNYTVPNLDHVDIRARWHSAPEIIDYKFTVNAVNGFVCKYVSALKVSDIQVPNDEYIVAVKDPNNPLVIKRWRLTGTLDNGEKTDTPLEYENPTWIYLFNDVEVGGKGGKGGGQQQYPWNITITGEADICAEHEWDEGSVTKEPTYVDYGEKTYTCKVCGTQETEPIPMLPRYCVHACSECGKCTLPNTDTSCAFERCSCEGKASLPTQDAAIKFIHNNGTGEITPHVYTVVELQPENPYVQYVLRATEGYDIEGIYDISFTDKDGNKYTPTAGETVTVTLKVGVANAQAINDGRMNIIHITDNGNEIYGHGNNHITANVSEGTVRFTVESFSPFVLARNAIEYYGRSALKNLPNSTALLYAYDQITAGVGKSEAEISVYNGTDVITENELMTVLDAYRFDHTEHFWFGNNYSCSWNSTVGTVDSLKPSYTMSGTELEDAKARFNTAAAELLNGITSSMSEYDREKELHDRLAARVSYVDSGNAHNAYGALAEGKAVCEGYAKAYQYLLQRAGLQSFIVTGSSKNPSTGKSEGHAWNIVRVDGNYYHVDLTWDDQGERIFYAYFNKTDSRIKEDHTIDETVYELPVCNSETADYFTVNGGKTDGFDAATVGTMLKNGGGTARVYVTGDKKAFIEAFKANISTVAQYAEISGGFTYGYGNLGREYILKIAQTGGYTVSGTAVSFGSETEKVKIELIKSGTTVAETEVSGNSTGYSVPNVEAGSYTLRVSKKNHVTRDYTVTVGTENVLQDVKIHLKGDINGDGVINIKDKRLIYYHMNNSANKLTGYAFDVGDVNGDGVINIKDKKLIYNHMSGTSLWS